MKIKIPTQSHNHKEVTFTEKNAENHESSPTLPLLFKTFEPVNHSNPEKSSKTQTVHEEHAVDYIKGKKLSYPKPKQTGSRPQVFNFERKKQHISVIQAKSVPTDHLNNRRKLSHNRPD